ncbi:MAG: alpha/beta hydrolase [Myxococcota bacterium]
MSYPELFGPPARSGRATSLDGTSLAWELYGTRTSGLPPLVLCNGVGCSTFFWHYMVRYFAPLTEVVIWDYRGHGDSGPPPHKDAVTMEDNAADLRAVMDAAGFSSAVLVGHSMGSQVVLETYRNYPDRVAALVPVLGTFGRAIDTFFNTHLVSKVFPFAFSVVQTLPNPIQATVRLASRSKLTLPAAALSGMVNGTTIRKRDMKVYLQHLAEVDVRLFMRMAREMGRHTAEDILSSIGVPVLVVGGERDIYTPLAQSRKMHDLIPDSELLIIPGGSHAGLVEQPELLNLRLEKFIRARVATSKERKARLATVG